VLLALVGAPSFAQDSAEDDLLSIYGDEEIISIATGRRQSVATAPAVGTVITAQDIRAMAATDLDQILETVPGLHVGRSPGFYAPVYSFRGIYSDFNAQVLLLVNGQPLKSLYTGNRTLTWGGMPVEAISRVEVIRGPGSAVYGADAFAGVINVVTKDKADIPAPEAGARVGSFSTQDVWGLYGGTWGGIDVALSVEYHATDGQRERIDADGQSALDSAVGTDASLAPGPVDLQRDNLDVRLDLERGSWKFRSGLQRRRSLGVGAGVAQALDPHGEYAADRWNADLTYHNPDLLENWDVTAVASFLQTSQEVARDLRLFPPGTTLPIGADGNINAVSPAGVVTFSDGLIGNPEVWERHYKVDLSAFYQGIRNHYLRFGVGLGFSDIYDVRESRNFGPPLIDGTVSPLSGPPTDVSDTDYVFLPEKGRSNRYAFVQDEWHLAATWDLTAGVRYDTYSDFGSTVNPRVALVWSASHNLTSKLMYGRGFRAPSFGETEARNNPAALGNPELKPEEIASWELGFDYRPAPALRFGLTLFRYQWDDIILLVPDSGQTSRTAQNAGEQTGRGFELEADWKPARTLRVVGNYALQDSQDRKSKSDAGYAPQQQAYLRASWEFVPHWQVTPQLNVVMDRQRVEGERRPAVDDYAMFDLFLRRSALLGHWEFAVGVRNMFDEKAREPSPAGSPGASIPDDLPLAGRNYFGELRYQF
jgi:iron complex outermembrane receptor protein